MILFINLLISTRRRYEKNVERIHLLSGGFIGHVAFSG